MWLGAPRKKETGGDETAGVSWGLGGCSEDPGFYPKCGGRAWSREMRQSDLYSKKSLRLLKKKKWMGGAGRDRSRGGIERLFCNSPGKKEG